MISSTDVGEERSKLIRAGYQNDEQIGEIYDISSTQKHIPARIQQYIEHFKIENGLLWLSINSLLPDVWRICIPNNRVGKDIFLISGFKHQWTPRSERYV